MELKGRYPENLSGPQRETHITYIHWILLGLWSLFWLAVADKVT